MSLKRKIPKLAVAAVTLAGCGEQSKVIVLENALSDYCKMERKCDPQTFEQYYGSVDRCTEFFTAYYSPYLAGVSRECVTGFAKWVKCLADQPCDDEDYYACDTEYYALDDLCEDEYFGYYDA